MISYLARFFGFPPLSISLFIFHAARPLAKRNFEKFVLGKKIGAYLIWVVILPVTNEITFWSEPGRSPTAPTAPGRRGEGGVLVLVVPKCCKTWGGFLETGQKPFKFSAPAADCCGRVFFWRKKRGIIDRLGPILVSFFDAHGGQQCESTLVWIETFKRYKLFSVSQFARRRRRKYILNWFLAADNDFMKRNDKGRLFFSAYRPKKTYDFAYL